MAYGLRTRLAGLLKRRGGSVLGRVQVGERAGMREGERRKATVFWNCERGVQCIVGLRGINRSNLCCGTGLGSCVRLVGGHAVLMLGGPSAASRAAAVVRCFVCGRVGRFVD